MDHVLFSGIKETFARLGDMFTISFPQKRSTSMVEYPLKSRTTMFKLIVTGIHRAKRGT